MHMLVPDLRLWRALFLATAFVFAGLMPSAYAADPPKEDNSGDTEHHYVRLDTITVTLFGEDSVICLYTVAATLEIFRADKRSAVHAGRSRLRDAMIVELPKLLAHRKGVSVPLDAVKYRLRNVVQRTLGKDVVVDLCVENVLRKDVEEEEPDKES